MIDSLQLLDGVKIVVSPDQPRYQFPQEWVLPCGEVLVFPDAQVVEINAWALEVCGTTNLLRDGEVFRVPYPSMGGIFGFNIGLSSQPMLMMNPRTYARVRRAVVEAASGLLNIVASAL